MRIPGTSAALVGTVRKLTTEPIAVHVVYRTRPQFIPFNIEIPLTRVIAKPAKRKNRATGKGNTDFAIASIVAGSFKENDVKNKSKTPLQTK